MSGILKTTYSRGHGGPGWAPGGWGSTKNKNVVKKYSFFARPPPKPTCWYRRYIYIYIVQIYKPHCSKNIS